MEKNQKAIRTGNVLQTIKSKIVIMGVFSILVAVGIGVLGINSLNRNSSNSEIESIVNEIDVLQTKNLALEAQYQYYIEQSYLDSIHIGFVEGVPAEDAIFTTLCFMKSKNVYYLPQKAYNYRLRAEGSISSSCSKKYFSGINKAYRIIYNNFKENGYLEYYRYFYAKSVNYILYKFILNLFRHDCHFLLAYHH